MQARERMKIRILAVILCFLITGLLALITQGCTPKSIQHYSFPTIVPMEENKYEIAGKEICEGMRDD